MHFLYQSDRKTNNEAVYIYIYECFQLFDLTLTSVSFVKSVAIIQTPTVWFGTFAVNLEVNDDWLHSPFAVPSETFARPPAHLPHEEFPDTAAHRSRPQKLILTQIKEEQDRKSKKSHRSGRIRKTTV